MPPTNQVRKNPATPVRSGRPPADLNSPVPVGHAAIAAHLKGTPDEVWTTLLRQSHGRERHHLRGWLDLIDGHRGSQA